MRKPAAVAVLVVALAAVFAATGAGAQSSDDTPDFVDVGSLTSEVPSGRRVLFFPLDESFGNCVPLTAPCPHDSSTLMLVPAAGRRLVWRPEGADLQDARLPEPAMRAIGTPPSDHESARYLVPVLDGAGINVVHARRRLESGRLVAVDSGDDSSAPDPVSPVLSGPLLSTAAPAPEVPARVLGAPVLLAASELNDAVAVLLVRRAAPNRIVFGLRPDPDWDLGVGYVAVLDEGVIAVAARRGATIGIAVAAPPGVRVGSLENMATRQGDDPDAGVTIPLPLVIGVAAAVVAAAAIALTKFRRARPT